jgi:hypothetical protein
MAATFSPGLGRDDRRNGRCRKAVQAEHAEHAGGGEQHVECDRRVDFADRLNIGSSFSYVRFPDYMSRDPDYVNIT